MRSLKNKNIWDKLALKYDHLWVQKYSLTPTRQKVKLILEDIVKDQSVNLLDVGCATGQLVFELIHAYKSIKIVGIDKSEEMIRLAKKRNLQAEFLCLDIDNCNMSEYISDNSLDIIICCHSFPYYKNKSAVLENLSSFIKDDGIMIFIQASINNIYDKMVMAAIEKTAEKADYLSRHDFRALVEPYFKIKEEFAIRERFFMPSICGFIMVKKS